MTWIFFLQRSSSPNLIFSSSNPKEPRFESSSFLFSTQRSIVGQLKNISKKWKGTSFFVCLNSGNHVYAKSFIDQFFDLFFQIGLPLTIPPLKIVHILFKLVFSLGGVKTLVQSTRVSELLKTDSVDSRGIYFFGDNFFFDGGQKRVLNGIAKV